MGASLFALEADTMPRPTEILDFLCRNRPFSELPEIDVHWLAERLSFSQLDAGEVLLHPGECPTDLIFILDGLVRVEAAGKSIPVERQLIAEIAADECFPLEALHEVRAVFSTYRASQPLRILKRRRMTSQS
jgi:signal-transduction protein with cAMP-binding, CBS, and nucleotidyltransferase domain